MGVYYFLVCRQQDDDRIVAHFNPQHGFGGLKHGEVIGTVYGNKILALLNAHFCPSTCKWDVIDDSDEAYEEMQKTKDFALNTTLRNIAIEYNIVTPQTLKFFDHVTDMLLSIFPKKPCDYPASLEELEENTCDEKGRTCEVV
jgi:hypothetical protein